MKYNINTITELEMCELVNNKIESRNLEEAYEILIDYVEKKPSVKTLTLLGNFYMNIGEPSEGIWFFRNDKAISILEQAVLQEPSYYYAYSLLGEAYIKENMNEKAEKVLKKALELNNDYVINNNLGVAMFKLGKVSEACQYFYAAHLLRYEKKYSYYPYLNYGICLAIEKDVNKSLAIAEQLIKLQDDDLSGEVDSIDISRIYYFNNNYHKVTYLISDVLQFYILGYDDFIIYSYSLFKINNCNEIVLTLNNICDEKEDAIQEISKDKWLSENDKNSNIMAIKNDIQKYRDIYNIIMKGAKPNLTREVYLEKNSYSFTELYKDKL